MSHLGSMKPCLKILFKVSWVNAKKTWEKVALRHDASTRYSEPRSAKLDWIVLELLHRIGAYRFLPIRSDPIWIKFRGSWSDSMWFKLRGQSIRFNMIKIWASVDPIRSNRNISEKSIRIEPYQKNWSVSKIEPYRKSNYIGKVDTYRKRR